MELVSSKNAYKHLERRLKRQYTSQQGNKLNYLRKHNPKSFYKQFEKRKHNVKSELGNDDFYNHFLNLALNEPTSNNEIDNFLTNYDTIDTDDSVSSLLDNDITER